MTILIPRQLTQQQYIKLFSNPVSGIACEVDAYNRDHRVNYHCQNIRYSKSMMVRALEFWLDYSQKYYNKIKRIYHPLVNNHVQIHNTLMNFQVMIGMVKGYPDSYLFSHRYIRPVQYKKYSNSLKIQHKLLQDKLGIKMIKFQEGTLEPYHIMHGYGDFDLEFTVFPNEHPYIPKQKIIKVGMTDRGNVYVLHKKEKNGTYTPTTTKTKVKKTVQAPKLWNKAQDVLPPTNASKLGSILRYMLENQSRLRMDDDSIGLGNIIRPQNFFLSYDKTSIHCLNCDRRYPSKRKRDDEWITITSTTTGQIFYAECGCGTIYSPKDGLN